jgi:valyl-tRNA synthetase
MGSAVRYPGFLLDERGIKMSKSIGNVVDPRTVMLGGKDQKKVSVLILTPQATAQPPCMLSIQTLCLLAASLSSVGMGPVQHLYALCCCGVQCNQ